MCCEEQRKIIFLTAHTRRVGNFHLAPRVVLFTDGRLTDFTNDNAKEEDSEHFLNESVFFQIYNHICSTWFLTTLCFYLQITLMFFMQTSICFCCQILRPLFTIVHQIGKLRPIYCFPVGENPNYVSLVHHLFKVSDV